MAEKAREEAEADRKMAEVARSEAESERGSAMTGWDRARTTLTRHELRGN